MLADAAYNAGQVVGLVIVVLIGVGLVRTFTRKDHPS